MKDEKAGNPKPQQQGTRSSPTEKEAIDAPPVGKKAVEACFALEQAFPSLEGLLQPYEFPSLKNHKEVIVALDTNALLLPFQIKSGDLPSLEQVYKRLTVESRLFVPGRVLREFVNNRDRKLAEIIHALNQRKSASQAYELPSKLLDPQTLEHATKVASDLKDAKAEYDKIITEIANRIRGWRGDDPVTAMYSRIFTKDSLVDLAYEKENRDSYLSDFRSRVAARLPPGYKDVNKQDEGIGDFLIWKSLLKLGEEKKLNLAFVTGEEKGDWYVRVDDGRVFPRVELVDEYRRASAGKLIRLLSLHDLLRELDVESTIVDEVERAEEVANTQIREFRASTFSIASSSALLSVRGRASSLLQPSSMNHLSVTGLEGALLWMRRDESTGVEIIVTPPSRIYPTGKTPGEIFNLLELELGSPVEKITIKHNDAVIVATGKGKNVGVRFDLERLDEETVRTTWTVAPEGSSIILP